MGLCGIEFYRLTRMRKVDVISDAIRALLLPELFRLVLAGKLLPYDATWEERRQGRTDPLFFNSCAVPFPSQFRD